MLGLVVVVMVFDAGVVGGDGRRRRRRTPAMVVVVVVSVLSVVVIVGNYCGGVGEPILGLGKSTTTPGHRRSCRIPHSAAYPVWIAIF